MLARAFWTVATRNGEVLDETLPAPQAGEVLVETLFSAVSRGTESLVFNGRVPKSEFSRMRCPHQVGDFPAPVKYGYASVGRVVAGSRELDGRAVFCLYPHQSAYVVPAAAVVPLPSNVPPARAVLAANLETAVNALWDGAPRLGDRVSVVGVGVVGALVAYLARHGAAVDVELVDRREERSEIARTFGTSFAVPENARRDRDLVIHASGTAEGLRTALALAGKEGVVLELSWFGDTEPSVPLGASFHSQRLTLRSSQVGSVSPNARPRFTHRSRLELALSLCSDPALDVLISSEGTLDELPAAMRVVAAPDSGALCHRVRYP
ncbi:MAG TPA: zinc-binding alcohol dehydrogenase [Polyangiaceae bacterium]